MFHAPHCNHSCTHESNHSCDNRKHSYQMSDQLSLLIKAVREKAGDSPAKAADKIGISRQGYVKWEQGDTSNMKLGNLLAFCDKYGVPIEKLIRGTLSPDETSGGAASALAAAAAACVGSSVIAAVAGGAGRTGGLLGGDAPKAMDSAITKYNTDEEALLKGFRVADQSMRRAMLALAREAFEVFERRSEQNN